jgi:transposase
MQIVREYVYVFGAVSPSDGRHDSLVLPYADTEAMSLFLEEIGRRYPDEQILMFMDQAGWHKSQALGIPPNIELAFLPPYSPELNPQEQVWDELREKFVGNKLFKSLEAVIDGIIPFHISNVRYCFCKYQKNNMFAERSLTKVTGNGITEGLRCLEASPLTLMGLTQRDWM